MKTCDIKIYKLLHFIDNLDIEDFNHFKIRNYRISFQNYDKYVFLKLHMNKLIVFCVLSYEA